MLIWQHEGLKPATSIKIACDRDYSVFTSSWGIFLWSFWINL